MRGLSRLFLPTLALVCGSVLFSPPAHSATDIPDSPDFETWLKELRAEAQERGVSDTILEEAFQGVRPLPRVIELDRSQPEGRWTLQQYLNNVVTAGRVKQAKRRLKENQALLDAVGKAYGVQPRFLVSLWGIETSFGHNTGGFKVIDALTTLAHDGRRSAYFRGELLDALTILEQGHIQVRNMKGSWAGAMGQCQFMPSSFLKYAQDYDGDGKQDIWNTRGDIFASAANYLSKEGWKDDETWGREVLIPKDFDATLAGEDTIKTLSDWQALGVRRIDGTDLPTRDLNASLILIGDQNPRAFIIYDNFRTILTWNRSYYFAVAVGTLADRIGRG
ncbi:MAG: lytic murein transglycosylase [Magnetospiraceae bacterium]